MLSRPALSLLMARASEAEAIAERTVNILICP